MGHVAVIAPQRISERELGGRCNNAEDALGQKRSLRSSPDTSAQGQKETLTLFGLRRLCAPIADDTF